MKKYRGFNFVELLLVLLILGIVISLTMPLLQNIRDNDKIYRAYRQKALEDVSDGLALAMIKKPRLTGLDQMGAAGFNATSADLRNLFNTAIPATICNENNQPACGIAEVICLDATCNTNFTITDGQTPGFTVGGKIIMMFYYSHQAAANNTPESFGYVYVDANGNKGPNTICQDRYLLKLYNDSAELVPNYVNGVENTACNF